MSKYIDADQIRAELERSKVSFTDFEDDFTRGAMLCRNATICALLNFLDSIPEQPELKPMNIPSTGGRMGTTPPKFKLDVKPEQENILIIDKKEWEAQEEFRKNKKFGQPLPEQPGEELEKEIDACWQNWLSPSNQKEVEGVLPKTEFATYAHHFAEWGRKQVLQEIYDGKVRPVDKITAAWLDDEQNT